MGYEDLSDNSSRGGSAAPEDDKKPSSATQIRKAQNRIAQREFRLRKQQYIRDLEARVEILSADKEERVELLLLLIRNLLQENKDLRKMINSMASFIGDGISSCLPKLGLTPAQLDALLNRQDTDTAYDAFMALKAQKSKAAGSKEKEPMTHFPPVPPGAKRKRGSDAEPPVEELTRETLRKHTGGEQISEPGAWDFLFQHLATAGAANHSNNNASAGPSFKSPTNYSSTLPQQQSTPGPSNYQLPGFPVRMGGGGPAPGEGGGSSSKNLYSTSVGVTMDMGMGIGLGGMEQIKNEATRPSQSMTLGGGDGRASSIGQGSTPGSHRDRDYEGAQDSPDAEHHRNLRAAVAHLTNKGIDQAPSAAIVTNPNNMTQAQVEERLRLQEELRKSMEGEEATERKTEALQLITYHLNNFRINHEYKLPPSLQPTDVQRTMPHEHAIDGILFPTMRDRMILMRGRYDLVEAFHGYITDFTLHGDDVLDHRNWEASEDWLNKYSIIADEEVYAITNKWRATRGARALIRPPDGPDSGSGLGTGAGLVPEFLQTRPGGI